MPGREKSLRAASFFGLEPRPNPSLPTTHSSFLCHAREAFPPSDLPKHGPPLCAQAAGVLGTSPWRRRSSRAFAALGGVTGPFPPPQYGHARDARYNSPRPMRLSEWVCCWYFCANHKEIIYRSTFVPVWFYPYCTYTQTRQYIDECSANGFFIHLRSYKGRKETLLPSVPYPTLYKAPLLKEAKQLFCVRKFSEVLFLGRS